MWCLHMLGLTAIVAAVAVDMTAEVSPSALTVADPPSQVLGSVDAGGGTSAAMAASTAITTAARPSIC